MTRKSLDDLEEELLKKQKQIQERLKDLNSRKSAQKRKDDTHLKILVGAICLNHADQKPEFKKWLVDALKNSSTKQRDLDIIAERFSEND